MPRPSRAAQNRLAALRAKSREDVSGWSSDFLRLWVGTGRVDGFFSSGGTDQRLAGVTAGSSMGFPCGRLGRACPATWVKTEVKVASPSARSATKAGLAGSGWKRKVRVKNASSPW